MPEDWMYQLSASGNGPMVNVRGWSPEHFIEALNGVNGDALAAVLSEAIDTLTPMVAPNGNKTTAQVGQQQMNRAVQQVEQNLGGSVVPTCQHGERMFKSGQKAGGKKWSAWFCPAKVCDPEWG